MSADYWFEKSNGRLVFGSGSTPWVSACNDGWKNGDQNGTVNDKIMEMSVNTTNAYIKLEFENGDKLYIDVQP